MPNQTWKAIERRVAAMLGGVRVPITGRARGSAPDIQHELYSLEVKHRKSLPGWLYDAMSQAKASIRGEQIPVVVLHQHRQEIGEAYVVLRLKDFADYFGGGGPSNNGTTD